MRTYLPFCLLAATIVCVPAYSATVYNESISGDLSNNGFSPTVLTVAPGLNQVIGTTGNHGSGPDRDYFTVTIPSGYQIGQLIELGGTEVGANVSFLALQAGPQVTVPTNPSSAAGLLGWDHYAPVASDTDLLPELSVSSDGSSGFSALPSGQYSFWIQDFNTGTFAYAFDITVTPTPEPATYATSIAALAIVGLIVRRRSANRKVQPSRA